MKIYVSATRIMSVLSTKVDMSDNHRNITQCAPHTRNCLCTWYLIFPLLLSFNPQQMLTQFD